MKNRNQDAKDFTYYESEAGFEYDEEMKELHRSIESEHVVALRIAIDKYKKCNLLNRPYHKRHQMRFLHFAAQTGFSEGVELLLKGGADPNCTDKYMRTPLLVATKEGNTGAFNLLLEYGANPHLRNTSENTCMHVAACNGHQAMVVRLLKEKPDIFAKNVSGSTAREIASTDEIQELLAEVEKRETYWRNRNGMLKMYLTEDSPLAKLSFFVFKEVCEYA